MNTNEEMNYQRLLEVLDGLELSEKNRRLAEQYLEPGQTGGDEILAEAERQDFTKLQKENHFKSYSYVEHCRKRSRTEELTRYIRFITAIGGSTVYYLLVHYYYVLRYLEPYLTKVQNIAIAAEGVVWDSRLEFVGNIKRFFEIGKKDPDLLRQAMEICYNEADNAKLLLAGIYLNCTSGNAKDRESKAADEVLSFLEDALVSSLPYIFANPAPSEEQIKEMQEYIKKSSPSDPLPMEFYDYFNGKVVSEYLVMLLSGSAFLALPHSEKLLVFLKLLAAINFKMTMNGCLNMAGTQWFQEYSPLLEPLLPVNSKEYMIWCIKNKAGSNLIRLSKKDPQMLEEVIRGASEDEYAYIMKQLESGNPQLHQDLSATMQEVYRNKIVQTLTASYQTAQMEAQQYLLGNLPLESLYPFVDSWRNEQHYHYYNYKNKLEALKGTDPQMFNRVLVLEALNMRGDYFTSQYIQRSKEGYKEGTKQLIAGFEEEGLPLKYQLDAFDAIHEGYYSTQDKSGFIDGLIRVLTFKKNEIGEELGGLAKTATAIGRYICIRFMDCFHEEYKAELLACAVDTSKLVREFLTTAYASHKEWEPEIKQMLLSKKSQQREIAISVMKQWGLEKYQAELQAALEIEKSKKIKQLLESCLGIEAQEEKKEVFGADLVTEILKGGRKRRVSWAYETPFSAVRFKNGSPASEEWMQALLVCYADMEVLGVHQQAKQLAAELEQKDLNLYVSELFDKWLDSGAEAKKKWVLYAASIHGGDAMLSKLLHQIQEWPVQARGAMAAEAVRALALNSAPEALLNVDRISRKFKFRQVKNAAGEALEYAAKELGISREELEDRIVPNLGFDASLKRTFDYGERSFTVYLSSALELEVFDAKEKKLKNLPAPGKKDDPEKAAAAYEEYKQMKKQMKVVVANQKLRLDQALSSERLWEVSKWKELFVENPVMHQFAIGLVWGVYEEDGLKDTFRYMDDGSFNTMDEEEYELADGSKIGLVHPVELDPESLAAWKEQLSDYEIEQPIEQLNRKINYITEEEKSQKELTRFGGMMLIDVSLTGKLQGLGWYRGSVLDAGGYYTFYREDGPIGVELEFSGTYIGSIGEEVTVYGAKFYKAGTVSRGSYIYDEVKAKNRYLLGEITPRYFSEIVLQLEKATASSKEQLEYPKCKNR